MNILFLVNLFENLLNGMSSFIASFFFILIGTVLLFLWGKTLFKMLKNISKEENKKIIIQYTGKMLVAVFVFWLLLTGLSLMIEIHPKLRETGIVDIYIKLLSVVFFVLLYPILFLIRIVPEMLTP